MKTPSHILISVRFRAYDKSIRDIWEAYRFHSFYLPLLHRLVKENGVPPFKLTALGSAKEKEQNRKDTLGVISHILSQVTPQRSLIAAVSHSEAFLQYVVMCVLRDFPGRLVSTQIETTRENKVLEIVVNSADKPEILDKLIEERVRGLFYGAPGDLFLKDRAKLGFGNYFSVNCGDAIERYTEITARRNLLIHNDARVDRKYLREVPGSPLALGQKVGVDEVYLRDALLILRGLCATAGILVSERVYSNKVPPGAKMLERHKAFSGMFIGCGSVSSESGGQA